MAKLDQRSEGDKPRTAARFPKDTQRPAVSCWLQHFISAYLTSTNMAPIRTRVRGPSSVVTLEADDDWTLAQLLDVVREKTGVASFTLKAGYPPTALDLSAPGSKTLGPLKLSGATLMVIPTEGGLAGTSSAEPASESAPALAPPQPAPKPFTPKRVDVDETVVPWDEGGGYLGEWWCRNAMSYRKSVTTD